MSAGHGHRFARVHRDASRSRPSARWTAAIALLASIATLSPSTVSAFSFSEEAERDEASRRQVERGPSRSGAGSAIRADCRARIERRRTVVLIAERSDDGGYRTEQSAYGPHLQALTRRLRELGVRTYSAEEIRAQVAQEEIDAYFRNDPDAALAAASKLGADLFLRGVISSRSTFNEFMGLPEVAISMGIALADRSGAILSEATASADSYSGADTLGMALRLTNERAPGVVTKLFADYCRLDRTDGS